MAIHLGRLLPGASRDLPGRRRGNPLAGPLEMLRRGRRAAPIRSCSRWGLPCRPRHRGRGALLPHPFTLTDGPGRARSTPAVCFLWHFPWGRPRRALPGTVFPWSPDFPPPGRNRGPEGDHPTVWPLIGRPAGRRRQPAVARSASRRCAVSESIRPSTRLGRKCRWKAATTRRVGSSSRPVTWIS